MNFGMAMAELETRIKLAVFDGRLPNHSRTWAVVESRLEEESSTRKDMGISLASSGSCFSMILSRFGQARRVSLASLPLMLPWMHRTAVPNTPLD